MENHRHDGIDNYPINPKDLLGFPIFTSAPTHKAIEGTIVFVIDAGTYYMYVMLDKGWRGTELTL